MKTVLNFILVLGFILLATQINYGQKACCAAGSKSELTCNTKSETPKACCSTASKNESTSGCTPSNCRGAKTKFGEAKVISNLRLELIALKAKLENHKNIPFSEEAISLHDIIGETDDQSIAIAANHLGIIQSEINVLTQHEIPPIDLSNNKAEMVSQLQQQIKALNKVL